MKTKQTQVEINPFNGEEFYDLCCNYRVANMGNQEKVIERFEDIKNYIYNNQIKTKVEKSAPELLEALINLNKEISKSCSLGSDPLLSDLMSRYQEAYRVIQKVTN